MSNCEQMNSIALLKDLERIPIAPSITGKLDIQTVAQIARRMDRDRFAIEIALGVEVALRGLFDQFNVPDDLQEAYKLAFSASDTSLSEHFTAVSDRGDKAVSGFISSLKGKLAEVRAPEVLKEHFPEHNFSLADSPINPDWDLHGITEGADDVFVQIKMGTSAYAYSIVDSMEASPDTTFAVSTDIYDKLMNSHPELGEKLIDLKEISSDFTETVTEKVQLLVDNHGIDVPDSIGDFLPYISEVVLGIRLIADMVAVEKDFQTVSLDNRARVHAMKAIALFSRFGITTVCTTAAGAAGTAVFPGAGSVVGAISGAILASQLNKRLKPRMLQVAMKVAGVTDDDLFYFRHKIAVDEIGASLASTASGLAAACVN